MLYIGVSMSISHTNYSLRIRFNNHLCSTFTINATIIII